MAILKASVKSHWHNNQLYGHYYNPFQYSKLTVIIFLLSYTSLWGIADLEFISKSG